MFEYWVCRKGILIFVLEDRCGKLIKLVIVEKIVKWFVLFKNLIWDFILRGVWNRLVDNRWFMSINLLFFFI